MKKQRHIAIIGAGMTGASAAASLRQHGFMVTVFEKSRGAGGRMSSKRTDYGPLDLGAQYFTARHADFAAQVALWQQAQQVAVWDFEPVVWDGQHLQPSPDQQLRFVGTPTMNEPVKALLGDTPLYTQCRIANCQYQQSNDSSMHQGQWQLTSDDGAVYLGFDGLLVTTPLPQAKSLLDVAAVNAIPDALMQPCWALQLVMSTPLATDVQGIFVNQGLLRWVSCQSAKPTRQTQPQIWLLHFTAEFTQSHLEIDLQELKALGCMELERMLGQPVHVEALIAQRWLYANINDEVAEPGIYTDLSQQLVVAGDWSFGGRVENAYLAGRQAAQWWILQG